VNAELKPYIAHQVEQVKPDGRSKYSPSIMLRDGVLTIAIRQVERKWLPMSIFGRVVLSKAVRLIGASTVEAILQNGSDGLVVISERGAGGTRTSHSILGVEWPVDFREKVYDEITRQLHRPQSGFSASISGTGAIAIAAFAAYLIVAAIAGPKAVAQAPIAQETITAPALSASEADAMTSSNFAQKAAATGPQLTPVAAAAQATPVNVRPAAAGGKGIVIWSDPLCPHCRDFEQKVLAKIPASIGVTVIPVSFKHGSRPLVANVLCAADAVTKIKRWGGLMAEQPIVDLGEQCSSGAVGADNNSALFARAGLNATPTIMKTNGSVFTGDKESVDSVVSWLSQP